MTSCATSSGCGDDEVDELVATGTVHEMNRPDTVLERPYLHWIRAVTHLPWPPSTFEPAELFMRRLEAERPRPTARADADDGDGGQP